MLRSKVDGLARWQRSIAILLVGALLALGQAPFDLPWFIFFGVPVLYAASCSRQWWTGFAVGWLAGFGYFLTSLHWIVEPFLVDVARTGWMAPFALVLMAGGLALFWAVPFAVFARFGGGILAFAALWTFGEFARSTVLTGFPWALLAYGWIEMPVGQGLAYLGAHGLGFMLVAVALLPLAFGRIGFGGTILLMATAWVGLGLRVPDSVPSTGTTVRLVQPNAPQHLKWKEEHLRTFWERQLGFTREVGTYDLVVWPETAVPYLLGTRPELDAIIAQAAAPAHAIFGATRTEGERWINAAAILAPDGKLEAVYDKHHLVPFGEFLPFPEFFERFGLQALAQNAGRFASGPGPEQFEVNGLPAFQLLICYEAIFPAEILRGDGRPDWLLHVTNDAWFGQFSGPFQHLAQAKARAIEFGLPLARSANTGVSGMIDPYGRMSQALPLGEAGFLDANLPEPLPPTLYAIWGDWPFLAAIALILALSVAIGRRNGRKLTSDA